MEFIVSPCAGDDCKEWFAERRQHLDRKIWKFHNEANTELKLGRSAENINRSETKCWFCKENFKIDDIKDRDHCYLTGKQRRTAHQPCDLSVKKGHSWVFLFFPIKLQSMILISF